MKYAIYFFIILAAFTACKQNATTQEATTVVEETAIVIDTTNIIMKDTIVVTPSTTGTVIASKSTLTDISSLRKLNGSTLKSDFFDNLIVKQRLQTLLGKERYSFMIDYWSIGKPVELENNILVTSGCMSHNCPNVNFIVIIDIAKNTFHAGIRENDVIKTYSENENNKTQWIKQRLQHCEDTYGD